MIDLSNRSHARVLLLSDTHGHIHERVLAQAEDCDLVMHAGDVGSGVAELLEGHCERVLLAAGNNDAGAGLPLTVSAALPGGVLAAEHGDRHGVVQPDHERLRAHHPLARLIVYGHSHKLVIDRSADPWVANPGAAGATRTNGGASCLVLDAQSRDWELQAMRWP